MPKYFWNQNQTLRLNLKKKQNQFYKPISFKINFNPFQANVPILGPLKKLTIFWFFNIFMCNKNGTFA